MNKNLPNNQSNFILYTGNDGKINVDVFVQDETIWLTQKAIGNLFGKSKATISEHLKKIYAEGELQMDSTVRNFRTVQAEGSRQVERDLEYYNLDAINVPPINKHPANIYKTGEFGKEPTISILEIVQKEGTL